MAAFGVLLCLCCSASCSSKMASKKQDAARGKDKASSKGKYEFVRLNDKFKACSGDLEDTLQKSQRAIPKAARALMKKREAEEKRRTGEEGRSKKREQDLLSKIGLFFKEGLTPTEVCAKLRPCVFVVEFDGDMNASAGQQLRKLVDVLREVADPKTDEVVLKLNSPGGTITGYGYATLQLMRLRSAGIRLTACVDIIAASGGYMMACVASKIVASPFAILGSIGVVAYVALNDCVGLRFTVMCSISQMDLNTEPHVPTPPSLARLLSHSQYGPLPSPLSRYVPNFDRILKKNDVDVHLFTAGKYKRTVDVVGPVTDEGKAKFNEEMARVHTMFKTHCKKHRPQLDVEVVCTGEAWSAEESMDMKLDLCDELVGSDEYLTNLMATHDVIRVRKKKKKENQPLLVRILNDKEGAAACKALSQFGSPFSWLLSFAGRALGSVQSGVMGGMGGALTRGLATMQGGGGGGTGGTMVGGGGASGAARGGDRHLHIV